MTKHLKIRIRNKDKTHPLNVTGIKVAKPIHETHKLKRPSPAEETQVEIENDFSLSERKTWQELYQEGRELSHQGVYSEALIRFQMANQILSTSLDIPNHIGMTYFHLKKYDEAEETFRSLYDKFPDSMQVLDNLITTVQIRGEEFEENGHCECAMISYKEHGRLLVERMDIMESVIALQNEEKSQYESAMKSYEEQNKSLVEKIDATKS